MILGTGSFGDHQNKSAVLLSSEPRGARTAEDEVLHGHRAVLRAVIPLTHHTPHPQQRNGQTQGRSRLVVQTLSKDLGCSAFFLKNGTLKHESMVDATVRGGRRGRRTANMRTWTSCRGRSERQCVEPCCQDDNAQAKLLVG